MKITHIFKAGFKQTDKKLFLFTMIKEKKTG